MTIEDAIEEVRDWLTKELDSRDDAIPDNVIKNFDGRGKEERALWRNALLELIGEVRNARGAPVPANNPRVRELQHRFDLDLDPTAAAKYITDALNADRNGDALDDGDEATLSPLEIEQAIRAVCVDPLSEETGKQIEALAKRTGQVAEHAVTMALLRRYRAADLGVSAAQTVTDLVILAEKIGSFVRMGRPPIPITRASFGRWNLLDLIDPFALRMGKALSQADNAPEPDTICALSDLASALVRHLSEPAPWYEFAQLASEELQELPASAASGSNMLTAPCEYGGCAIQPCRRSPRKRLRRCAGRQACRASAPARAGSYRATATQPPSPICAASRRPSPRSCCTVEYGARRHV